MPPARPHGSPLRWAARGTVLALLAVVAVAAANVRSPMDAALAQAAAQGWHGAYDILVTADGTPLGHDGLLPPNELASRSTAPGQPHLDEHQLDLVRKVPGVDVAAPLGYAQLLGDTATGYLTLSHDSSAMTASAKTPQAYDITVNVLSDDGTGARGIGATDERVIVDADPPTIPQQTAAQLGCSLGDVTLSAADAQSYPALFARFCGVDGEHSGATVTYVDTRTGKELGSYSRGDDGDLLVPVMGLPAPSTRVVLVDPVAERKLLGAAGDFLAPLAAFASKPQVTAADAESWAVTAGSAVEPDVAAQLARLARSDRDVSTSIEISAEVRKEAKAFAARHPRDGARLTDMIAGMSDATAGYTPPGYVPLLYTAPQPKLTAEISVTSAGPAVRDTLAHEEVTRERHYVVGAGQSASPGAVTGQAPVSSLADLFRADVALPWPGSTTIGALPWDDGLMPVSGVDLPISTPDYQLAQRRDGIAATLRPQGFVTPLNDYLQGSDFGLQQSSPAGAAPTGSESSYYGITAASGPTSGGIGGFLKLGGVDPDAVAAASRAAGDAPLGAYETLPQKVTSPQSGSVLLGDSVYGLGVTSGETTAIADVDNALGFGFSTVVGSIRVRVAGTHGYDAAGRAKLERVAQAIGRIPGLRATIVVGSSRVPVTVTIAGYAFPALTNGGAQQVGTLGTTRQQWTRLGPAATAGFGGVGAAWGLVAAAFAAVLELAASAESAGIGRGIRMPRPTTPRMRRGSAAEAGPGSVAPLADDRASAEAPASNPPRSPLGFGLRRFRAYLPRWLPLLLAGPTAGAFSVLLVRMVRAPEPGRVPLFALIAVGLLVAVLLAAAGALGALRGRRAIDRLLAAAAWTPGDRLTALLAELLAALLIALAAAAVAAAVVGSLLPPGAFEAGTAA